LTKAVQIRHEIQNLIALLIDNELAIDANAIVVETVDSRHRVTWSSHRRTALTAGPFATIEEYSRFLEYRAYSVLLRDGSFLQLSYDFRNDDIVGHRLCFYPCPVEADPDLILQNPVLDVVELYADSGLENIRLRSPMRFDYSANESAAYSQAHVHISWDHCRCPVYAPLSLGHFVRFVFASFYPWLWNEHEFLREWPTEQFEKTILECHETALHFACETQPG